MKCVSHADDDRRKATSLRSVKRYKAIQNKLQRKQPDDAEENVTSQIILPTRKQLWGGIILLAVLAFAILFLSILMLWLMISYYENIFLILFIFLVSLSLPVLAVMVTYIRLLLWSLCFRLQHDNCNRQSYQQLIFMRLFFLPLLTFIILAIILKFIFIVLNTQYQNKFLE